MTCAKNSTEKSDKLILNYSNKSVVQRYCKDHNKSMEYGHELFIQFLKFMYVADVLSKKLIPCYMAREIREIDNIWHSFLLFTQDYEDFCLKFFNRFLHHRPVSEEQPHPSKEVRKELLHHFVTTVYEAFGKETLVDWFKNKKYA